MGSSTEADGVKKRQPRQNSFGGGYSTDESNDSHMRAEMKDSSKRRKRRADVEKDSVGKATLIWMVLVIGLMFCLLDAAYIARVLDRGPTIEEETNIMAADLVLRQLKQNYIPLTKSERAHIQDFSEYEEEKSNPQHTDIKKKASPPQLTEAERNTQIGRQNARQKQRAERLAQQKKEKEEAEAKRVRNIKMAALEALKAEHGGKIPDDMIDKALADEEAFKPRPMSYYKERAIEEDKDKILDIFMDAGLKEMDDSTFKVLPKWGEVTALYGEKAVISGLDQCETFRAKGNPWDHFVSTAGTFNSGTNLMAEMLIHNCHMEERMKKLGHQNRGIRWQVPWGKHTPPGNEEYRLEHKSIKDKDVDANMILPAVTVRDPYYWMQSMCRHHYTASWRESDRCPNLTPTPQDQANYPLLRDKDYFPLAVRYADFRRHHKSLTGLWNDWYHEYKGVEFQRLFVRYEDLLFHPKEVTTTVCECAGGTMNQGKFVYQVDSAKKGVGAHGNVRTGYVDAIIKYGSEKMRYNGYQPQDLKYARETLDKSMMEEFGYKYHPLKLENSGEDAESGEGAEEEGGEAVQDGGNEEEDNPEEEGDQNAEHEEEKEAPEEPNGEEEEEVEKEAANGEEEEPEAEKSADAGEKDSDQDKEEAEEVDMGEAGEEEAAA